MHPYGVKYTPTFWNDEKSWGSNQAVQAERNILPLKTQAFPFPGSSISFRKKTYSEYVEIYVLLIWIQTDLNTGVSSS